MTAVQPRPTVQQRIRWNHPELPLVAVAAAAWVAILVLHLAPTETSPMEHGAMNHHPDPAKSTGQQSFPASLAHWSLMVTAMMLPTALPAARSIARNGKWKRRHRGPALFALGYLAAWTALGAVLLSAVTLIGPKLIDLLAVSAALLLAAIWQPTRWKRLLLRACHRIPPMPPDGPQADRACLRTGIRNGLTCIGSCAPMMFPMALAPHAAAFGLMLFLTALIWAEKLLTKAAAHLRLFAGLLAVAALVIAMLALTA